MTAILYLGLLSFIGLVDGLCYFNQDMQGHYLMQSSSTRGAEISYTDIQILQTSISLWGKCQRRFGNNVIFNKENEGKNCIRCLYIVARSTQVLEMHMEGMEKCYLNEGVALTKCPTAETIAKGVTRQMMLYKTKTLANVPVLPMFCPINGRFLATYNRDDGTESRTECPMSETVVSNCPVGSRMLISFRKCSFPNVERMYECLGSWDGKNGTKYLALQDPSIDLAMYSKRDARPRVPKYRCAIYQRDHETGMVRMAFSSDSTCLNNLHSANRGFETLAMIPQGAPLLPRMVNQSSCQFPSWLRGNWQHLKIEGQHLTFTDLREQKKYSAHCVGPPTPERIYPVYTQTHCGEESFACLAVRERSPNVIEFRISSNREPYYHNGICGSSSSLSWPRWITQGRVDRTRKSPCPVAGEYSGVIPDDPTLCAKLYSDCNNLDIMFYNVYACSNKSDVREEREYRCLGQWMETDVTYSYTERRDVKGHECFAGVVKTTEEVYIIEAGMSCERGLRPLSQGMKLTKQAACTSRTYHPKNTHVRVYKGGDVPYYTHVDSTFNRPVNKPGSGTMYEAPVDAGASKNYSWTHLCSLISLLLLQYLSNRKFTKN